MSFSFVHCIVNSSCAALVGSRHGAWPGHVVSYCHFPVEACSHYDGFTYRQLGDCIKIVELSLFLLLLLLLACARSARSTFSLRGKRKEGRESSSTGRVTNLLTMRRRDDNDTQSDGACGGTGGTGGTGKKEIIPSFLRLGNYLDTSVMSCQHYSFLSNFLLLLLLLLVRDFLIFFLFRLEIESFLLKESVTPLLNGCSFLFLAD